MRIKDGGRARRRNFPRNALEGTMPAETIVIVVLITAVFVIFAIGLAAADHWTHGGR